MKLNNWNTGPFHTPCKNVTLIRAQMCVTNLSVHPCVGPCLNLVFPQPGREFKTLDHEVGSAYLLKMAVQPVNVRQT